MADDQQPPLDPTQGQDDPQVTDDSALPEDNGTPFQPADDAAGNLDDTHQATDNQSNIDEHEAYDAGLPTAAQAEEPRDPGVASFTPPTDENADEEDDNGAGEAAAV